MTNVKQDLFDISLNHIRKQGKPAMESSGRTGFCMYHSSAGLSCAAAPFILSGYDEDMEGLGIHELIEGVKVDDKPAFPDLVLDPRTKGEADFCAKLQAAHDNAARRGNDSNGGFMLHYEDEMHMVAQEYNLLFIRTTF